MLDTSVHVSQLKRAHTTGAWELVTIIFAVRRVPRNE